MDATLPHPPADQPGIHRLPILSQEELDAALLRAVHERNSTLTILALRAGGDPNSRRRFDPPMLFSTFRQCDPEIPRLLLLAGADPNAKYVNGATLLISAIEEGNAATRKFNGEVCKYLIEAGADVNSKGKDGHTPLFSAILMDDAESCKHLLDAGADPLLPDTNGNPSLLWRPSVACSQLLIERGADPFLTDSKGQTPMAARAHPSWYGKYAEDLRLAEAIAGKWGQAKPEQTRAELDKALLMAAGAEKWDKTHEFMPEYVKLGANPNAVDKQGNTALHHASRANLRDGVKTMLALGADPEARNAEGLTPLGVAMKNGNLRCVPALREKTDLLRLDGKGRSYAELAYEAGHTELGREMEARAAAKEIKVIKQELGREEPAAQAQRRSRSL